MAALLPRRTLGRTGLSVSVLGFGASPLGGVFEAVDEVCATVGTVSSPSGCQLRRAVFPHAAQDEGIASVHEAIRQGINFFDCSPCVPSVCLPRLPT